MYLARYTHQPVYCAGHFDLGKDLLEFEISSFPFYFLPELTVVPHLLVGYWIMASFAEMTRRHELWGQDNRGAENYFGSAPINIATELFPYPEGVPMPLEERPEGEALNQYGDQVGPVMLDQAGNPIVVQLQHPAHPNPGVVPAAQQNDPEPIQEPAAQPVPESAQAVAHSPEQVIP